ncbi:MAG: AraC family transcriptional regulator [Clostridia bacterium]|nr:AraC family transcriptional regulator [Clostridia bacterium]
MKQLPLFTKTFISFIVFLILTVFIIGLIFNYSVIGYLEGEISKSGIGKLKVAKNNHELLANSVIQDAVKVSLSPYMNTELLEVLGKNKDARTVEDQEMLKDVLDSLSEVERTHNGIHSVYLYLEDQRFVFSSKTGLDSMESFQDTQWLKLYSENNAKGLWSFWLPSRIPYNFDQLKSNDGVAVTAPDYSPVITYIYSLTCYTTQLQGAVIINLYEDRLCNLINSKDLSQEGLIYIINSKGEVVSHTDKQILGKNLSEEMYIQRILEDKSEDGYIVTDAENKRQLITYYKSNLNGWIYIGAFSLDALMYKVENLRMDILLVLLLILVVGGAAAYLLSRRLFSPVRKLIQDIQILKGIDFHEEKNEVTILSKALDAIIKQDNQLYSLLEENKKEIRNSYLMIMFSSNQNQNQNMDLSIFDFKHPYYCCFVAAIDRYKNFTADFSGEQQYYLKTLMIGIFKEVLGSKFICEGLQIEKDKLGFIINTDIPGYENNLRILKKDLVLVQREIAKVLDNTVTISIGSIQENLSGIKDSYSGALDLLKLRLVSGHGSIITLNQAPQDERKYQYPFNHEKHILNHLSTNSKSGILSSVEAFIAQIKSNDGLSYDNAILMLNQLLGSTVRYLLDTNISMTQVFGNSFNIYQQLLDNETLDDIGLWLGKVYVSIIDFSSTQKADNKKYIEQAVDYIHQNYKSDIDINALAESIGVSYSQLRRAFLREKGDNLVDYINKLRIEEAKRLLLHSGETIMDLAINLGYNSDRTFNRFFKKYEGITPGEFRKAFK